MPGPTLDASPFRVLSIPGSGSRWLARALGCGFNHFGERDVLLRLLDAGKTPVTPLRHPIEVLLSALVRGRPLNTVEPLFRAMVEDADVTVRVDCPPDERPDEEAKLWALGVAPHQIDWTPLGQTPDPHGIREAERARAHETLDGMPWLSDFYAAHGFRGVA